MNAATRMNGMKQTLSTFWSERNRREQNMLSGAAVVILIGLVYTLLVDPALSGRTELQKQLPALRQQAAEAQLLARQATATTAKAVTSAPPMTRESLDAALARKGLKAQNIAVTGELAKLQFNGISFSALVDWLNEMQHNARLSVLDVNVEAQAQADTVNASLTLRQQRSE
jgi:general secretion pathway protein M